MVIEPYDWYLTAQSIYNHPEDWTSYVGMVPFVPGALGKLIRAADDVPTSIVKEVDELIAPKETLVLPRSLGAKAVINVESKIKNGPYAIRQAEALSQHAQKDVDNLLVQLANGNANPGIGTRALSNGFFELRGRNAGRVIIKQIDDHNYDIVGKFQGHAMGDSANSNVINRLMEEYCK
jgi:hypothetical protein